MRIDIRDRIRSLRKERGFSAERVAREMGISRPFYTLLEGGKRRLRAEHVEKIAGVLGVSVGELYGEDALKREIRMVVGRLKGKHVRPINAPELRKQVEHLLKDQTDDFMACYQAWVKAPKKLRGKLLLEPMGGDPHAKTG